MNPGPSFWTCQHCRRANWPQARRCAWCRLVRPPQITSPVAPAWTRGRRFCPACGTENCLDVPRCFHCSHLLVNLSPPAARESSAPEPGAQTADQPAAAGSPTLAPAFYAGHYPAAWSDDSTHFRFSRRQARQLGTTLLVWASILALLGLLTGWGGYAASTGSGGFGPGPGAWVGAVIWVLLGEAFILLGIALVTVGHGLRQVRPWARSAGIALGVLLTISFLFLSCFAIFTMPLGIYLLAALSQRPLQTLFNPRLRR